MEQFKPFINQALEAKGFVSLTEVQSVVIPKLLLGKNLIVRSVTGSGKTHSYLIPMFETIDLDRAELQFVISSPTRELAKQIFDFAKEMASFSPKPIDIRLYTGGTDRDREIERLAKNQPMIAIGTPGKLKDLAVTTNVLKTFQAKLFVVDEADMTLDAGFLEDVDFVAATMTPTCRMSVFSATIPESIQPFLKKYVRDAEMIDIGKGQLTNALIKHYFVKTKERDRMVVLKEILGAINPYLCIIFCNTKLSAEAVHTELNGKIPQLTMIHGDLDARKRRQVVKQIHELKYRFIVATDIISRGIDISNISHIVNFELPADEEFYIHRSGRTGRMAADGICISLYDYANDEYLNKLTAKGLVCEYQTIVKSSLIKDESKTKRQAFKTKFMSKQTDRSVVKTAKPDKVKPGYKKKFQEERLKIEKAAARKRGSR